MPGESSQGPVIGPESVVARRWAFGSVVVDERSKELLVGGRAVALERRPLEVLLYLLHHAGEVVTKDELAENLWPGRIVTDTVLARCISALRQALNDDAKTLIRTVHGYGYRLVADDIKTETGLPAPAPLFQFKAGDTPPLRPQWRLVERLGTGGHGEAWLARHEKTRDTRVFKFARDGNAVASLKREITLYRLLHDSLAERAAVARILEWNLEEPPYFLESEHVVGGNLRTWADAQGGLRNVPLTTRLAMATQIAEALAAAHSVGVLHKDLKPSNVLVGADGRIKLCDFGSGGVLDIQRLEALGITRLGFTKTVAANEATGGTPLYVAPEVIAGQPFTVQADIYALGVMLYQMIVGDLSRSLAPGWELEVEDELLREDISLAAAGSPVRRLKDAAQLVERLQMLDARRQARVEAVAEKDRAERTQRMLQTLRRTRAVALVLMILATAAVSAGVVAYRARDAALEATETARAISDFLMEDMLRIDPALEIPKDASYESLLDRTAAHVDTRLRDQPEAAVNVHWLLGRRYHEIGKVEAAIKQYERASALSKAIYGLTGEPTLLVLDSLSWALAAQGTPNEALTISEQLRTYSQAKSGERNPAILMLRARLAATLVNSGLFSEGEQEFKAVLAELPSSGPLPEKSRGLLKQWLGILMTADISRLTTQASVSSAVTAYVKALLCAYYLLQYAEDYRETEALIREALDEFRDLFGERHELVAFSRTVLTYTLIAVGRYDEAERHFALARDSYLSLLPADHFAHGVNMGALGRLLLERGRPSEATPVLTKALGLCTRTNGCPPTNIATLNQWLGESFQKVGRWDEALNALTTALVVVEKVRGPIHVDSLRKRVQLADALRESGNRKQATEMLNVVPRAILGALPARNQVVADFRRVEGLLWLEQHEPKQAELALRESLRTVSHRFGEKHWRTDRARRELALAQAALAASQASNSSGGKAGVNR